jgi:hypothetical protein
MDSPFPKILPPLLMAFLLALSPLQAAPKNNSVALPSTSSGEVIGSPRVVRGGVCEVAVRGIVMPRDSAKFRIHKNPKHGTLEGPVLAGSDTAIYTYRHNGKKGVDSDRIDFRIKTGPNNTWGPVTATITIEEPPSRVELIDSQLDFGPVPIGQTRSTFLQVRNGGGGILRISLETGAPWSIDGPAEFEIAEGEARDIRVVFSPDGPGERQGRLDVLAGRDRHPVTLRGEGVYRFTAPERVCFEKNATDQILEIPLTNLTDRELPLSIGIPNPLLGESEVALTANGTAVLRLGLEKRHYTEKSVEISLADGPAVKTLRVILPSPPALLEWAAEGGEVDLGETPFRHIPRPEFELRNRGATAATVRIREAGGGLSLAQDQPEEFPLRPGESAVIKTVWRLEEKPGESTAGLIASHGGLDHPLKLRAIVSAKSAPEEPKADSRPADSVPGPSPDPRRVLTEAEQKELKRRLPFDISTRLMPDGGSATARITWKYAGPEPVLFWLEKKVVERQAAGLGDTFERRLQVPTDLPKPESVVKWVRLFGEEAGIRPAGEGVWEATISGFDEGFHDVRIATRAPPDGPRIDYSAFVVKVAPLPPNPLWNWLAGAIGIICLLYLLRKKIRSLLGREPELR